MMTDENLLAQALEDVQTKDTRDIGSAHDFDDNQPRRCGSARPNS
jgi:hypothetical protein